MQTQSLQNFAQTAMLVFHPHQATAHLYNDKDMRKKRRSNRKHAYGNIVFIQILTNKLLSVLIKIAVRSFIRITTAGAIFFSFSILIIVTIFLIFYQIIVIHWSELYVIEFMLNMPACQGNTIISVTRPPTKIKQEREKRDRGRNRERRGLAQWF